MGIGSYALLFQGGAGKGAVVQALTPAGGMAITAGEQSPASDRAFFNPSLHQLLHQEVAPPPRALYVTTAQGGIPQGALSHPAALDPNSVVPHTAQETKAEPSVSSKGDEKAKPAKLGKPEAVTPWTTPAKAISSGARKPG
jgi:hypothetical protein